MKNLEELLKKLGKKVSVVNTQEFEFFVENSPEGIFSKTEYAQYLEDSPKWHINHLNSLHENMKLNRKINGIPTTQYEDGKEYIWCRFNYGNVRQNLKILNAGRMHEFITDYSLGKIRNIKSLEELVQELTEQ